MFCVGSGIICTTEKTYQFCEISNLSKECSKHISTGTDTKDTQFYLVAALIGSKWHCLILFVYFHHMRQNSSSSPSDDSSPLAAFSQLRLTHQCELNQLIQRQQQEHLNLLTSTSTASLSPTP